MQNVYLDGGKFGNLDEVHEFLAKEMGFPGYYGGNLAALYDVLTDVCVETVIFVTNVDALEGMERMVEVMVDAGESNEWVRVVVE